MCAHACKCGQDHSTWTTGDVFFRVRSKSGRYGAESLSAEELCGVHPKAAAAGKGSFLSHAGLIFSLRPEEGIRLNLRAVTSERAASGMMAMGPGGRCGKVCLSSELLRTDPLTAPTPAPLHAGQKGSGE